MSLWLWFGPWLRKYRLFVEGLLYARYVLSSWSFHILQELWSSTAPSDFQNCTADKCHREQWIIWQFLEGLRLDSTLYKGVHLGTLPSHPPRLTWKVHRPTTQYRLLIILAFKLYFWYGYRRFINRVRGSHPIPSRKDFMSRTGNITLFRLVDIHHLFLEPVFRRRSPRSYSSRYILFLHLLPNIVSGHTGYYPPSWSPNTLNSWWVVTLQLIAGVLLRASFECDDLQ